MAYPLAERPERQKPKPSEYDDKPLGTQFADETEKALEWATNLPVVKPALQAAGGALRVVYENVIDPLKYESEELLAGRDANVGAAILGSGIRAFEYGTEKGEEIGGNIAEAIGVDPRIGSFVGGAGAEALMTAGVGTVAKRTVKAIDTLTPPGAGGLTPALAGSGGGLKLDFGKPRVDVPEAPQVMPLTITKPERLAPGIREGIAKDPEIAKQLTKRAGEVLKQENRLVTWREFGGPRSAKNIKKAQADVYSKKSTMPQLVQDDPIAYRVAEYKDAAKINLEQHHLFTKAQSSAFVDRMQELIEKNIADQDDLVAMGEYAKHLGAAMGDVNSNMFNMHTKPHNIFHTKMRKAGQEVKPDVLMQQLRKAKNADELMDMFHDYIVDNVLPNKKAAKEAQAAWEIANPDLYGAQKASAMDIFIKELRERGA